MQIFPLNFENETVLLECEVERNAGVATYHNVLLTNKETGRQTEEDTIPEELLLAVAAVLSAKLED